MDIGKCMLGLAHIGVFTRDIEASIAFYTQKLGLALDHRTKLAREDDFTQLAFIKAGSLIIELIQPAGLSGIDARSTNGGIVGHIAIEVKNIEEVVDALRGAGIAFDTDDVVTAEAIYNGVKNIFFKGPDGESLELFEFL